MNPQYCISWKMHKYLRSAFEDTCVSGQCSCFSWDRPNIDIVVWQIADLKNVFNSRDLVASSTLTSSPWLPADICRQRCCSWRCSSSASALLMRIRRRAPSFLPKVGVFTRHSNMSAWQILGNVKIFITHRQLTSKNSPWFSCSEFWANCMLIDVPL